MNGALLLIQWKQRAHRSDQPGPLSSPELYREHVWSRYLGDRIDESEHIREE